jgi:phospholipid/cholesterol/gamma-HCH transport system permease protein
MNAHASHSLSGRRLQHWALAWLTSWWRLLQFAALLVTRAFLPSTYRRDNWRALSEQIVLAAANNLIWFTMLAALISLVIIRIVVVTSISYGLSRYALEMVVRVLVLELVPLTAALFVALRTTLPAGVEFAQQRAAGEQLSPYVALRTQFFPRAVAGMFAVWLLAAVSCVTTLILAYLVLYGFTPWALPGYTRVVGQIFNPAVSLILWLKIVFFSLAVAVIPLASSYYTGASNPMLRRLGAAHGLADMVRMFAVILLVEAASLMGNYY